MSTGPFLTSPVVSTQWLFDHLGAEKLVVLDATVVPSVLPSGKHGYLSGHDAYLINGHVPGSVFADLIDVFSDPSGAYPFTRPSAEAFAAAAGALGIDNDTTVVVYDSAVGQWASRIWWLFRTLGHDTVAVLDGGLQKWESEGRGTDVGHVEPHPATFTATERPELWADKSHVESVVAGEIAAALVCGLPPKEFTGEVGHRARLGHIPGSVSVPAGRLVDRETNALLDEDALRSTFAPVFDEPEIIVYCAAGIAAASDALALTLLGHRNVTLYDGSLSEWSADASAPLVRVEQPA
jgi:thiosulfate/3-mercaptopyruvate sulfurtransferase